MIIIEEKPDYINSPDSLRVLAGIRTLLSITVILVIPLNTTTSKYIYAIT